MKFLIKGFFLALVTDTDLQTQISDNCICNCNCIKLLIKGLKIFYKKYFLSTFMFSGPGPCSLIVQVEGQKNKFVISQTNNLNLITWDGESDKVASNEVLIKVEPSDARTRINDGKVDPAGRLWAGL